uniref:Uncharacterized protein n=1 Tax=Naja naja TaxID=35670 RepID=A0A8C7E4A8_NAJNA
MSPSHSAGNSFQPLIGRPGKGGGGRSYDNANSHPGSYFTIRLHIAPTYSPPIGRNKAIQSFLEEPGMQVPHPLLQLLNSTFLFLNSSRSNLTNSCWLCLSAVPPFTRLPLLLLLLACLIGPCILSRLL